ncbi:hypothetical protein BP6252_09151 [Coleophoma cylindrospora]|uniref:Chromatin modification-related protein EAF6 n=1 Tax=Coleophoma cylindrospora TaxID=1849047 RepID=A0A3D8R154_9HELO|nr:hypothetical protein BP6252_09151 [Coleophoma cylindrospora]
MAENVAPASAGPNGDVPGQPFYDKSRQALKKLLHQKRLLETALQAQEDAIFKKETEYLEETPSGNIITGFENYTKSSAAAPGGGRRKGQVTEANRVFSRSSISYNVDSGFDSATSTPMAAMAPTPVSASFQKGESASNHATPTSASSSNRVGAGAGKKNKKAEEEDEDDKRDMKKIRMTGAARK